MLVSLTLNFSWRMFQIAQSFFGVDEGSKFDEFSEEEKIQQAQFKKLQQEKLKNEQITSDDHQNFGADSPIENRDKNQIQQLSDQSIDDLKVDHGGQMTGDQADG